MSDDTEINPYQTTLPSQALKPRQDPDTQQVIEGSVETIGTFRRIIPWLKSVSGILIIICFFLPLSSCSNNVHIPINDMQTSTIWLEKYSYLLVYYFPLVFVPLSFFVKRYWPLVVLTAIELLVAGYASVDIHMYIYFMRNPLPAGYLAVFAITSYAIFVIIDGIRFFRRREFDYFRRKYHLAYWGP